MLVRGQVRDMAVSALVHDQGPSDTGRESQYRDV